MPVQELECEQQRGVCKYECDCEPDGEILPGLCPKQAGNSVVCCKPKYKQVEPIHKATIAATQILYYSLEILIFLLENMTRMILQKLI